MLFENSVGEMTDRLWITARVSLKSIGTSTPARLIVNTTSVPAWPRRVDTAFSEE